MSINQYIEKKDYQGVSGNNVGDCGVFKDQKEIQDYCDAQFTCKGYSYSSPTNDGQNMQWWCAKTNGSQGTAKTGDFWYEKNTPTARYYINSESVADGQNMPLSEVAQAGFTPRVYTMTLIATFNDQYYSPQTTKSPADWTITMVCPCKTDTSIVSQAAHPDMKTSVKLGSIVKETFANFKD